MTAVTNIASHSRICDDSGLCDVAESADLDRTVYRRGRDQVVVDISPIAVGHCLVVPSEHVTTSHSLGVERSIECWTLAEDFARSMSIEYRQSVATLEHGITGNYPGPSCVRHSHIHVCPVRVPGDLRSTLDTFLSELMFVPTRPEAAAIASEFHSHVVGRVTDLWFVGRPREGQRQITRAILAAMSETPPADVDWIFGAMGERYEATIRALCRRQTHTSSMADIVTSLPRKGCAH